MHAQEKPLFKGEDAFISALNGLSDTKVKVVYFLQGDGELDLNEAHKTRPEESASALKGRLKEEGYQVKGLHLSSLGSEAKAADADTVAAEKVPADATLVVAAGPTKPLSAAALKALDDYMQAKGKLVVLLDVIVDKSGKMEQTGLEKLVEKFNVKVEDDRLLRVPERFSPDLETILAITPPRSSNPVAAAFGSTMRFAFVLDRVRTVRAAGPPGAGTYETDVLLISDPDDAVWSETNLTGNPRSLLQALLKDRKQLREKLSKGPFSVAMAVSERSKPADGRPPLTGPNDSASQPRLVVFGNAKMLANPNVEKGRGNFEYDLFSSTLAWLRGRPENIGVPAKKSDDFKLKAGTDLYALLLLPALLMFLGIIGLGTGVWITRRR
jgi:hypothetical protein